MAVIYNRNTSLVGCKLHFIVWDTELTCSHLCLNASSHVRVWVETRRSHARAVVENVELTGSRVVETWCSRVHVRVETWSFQARVWIETRPLRIGDEVRACKAHSEALSSVIFRHPIEPPPKFSKLRVWLWRISEHFRPHVDLGFRDWTNNLLKCPDLVWILVFLSVLLND